MNPKVKEYIWSSFVTFVAAFSITIVPMVSNDFPMSQAAIFTILMTGVRAGARALLNLWATKGHEV